MLGVLVFPRAAAALVRQRAPGGALLVGVDAGVERILEAGRVPDRVVGDMDSVSEEALARAQALGARIERHPAEKRDTDAALALRHVEACDEIVFLGAGGGRADHALANLHLLAQASERAAVVAYDEAATMWVATPERPLALRLPVGATVSALPFDPRVEGITYEGLAYPLSDATMEAGDPYGVSNVVSAPVQRIRVRRGRLLVIHPR